MAKWTRTTSFFSGFVEGITCGPRLNEQERRVALLRLLDVIDRARPKVTKAIDALQK